jgi:hypothetical protein
VSETRRSRPDPSVAREHGVSGHLVALIPGHGVRPAAPAKMRSPSQYPMTSRSSTSTSRSRSGRIVRDAPGPDEDPPLGTPPNPADAEMHDADRACDGSAARSDDAATSPGG